MTKEKAARIVDMGTEIRDTSTDYDESLEMIGLLLAMFMPASDVIEERVPAYRRTFQITEQYHEAIMRTMNDPEKFDPVTKKLRQMAEATVPTGKGN